MRRWGRDAHPRRIKFVPILGGAHVASCWRRAGFRCLDENVTLPLPTRRLMFTVLDGIGTNVVGAVPAPTTKSVERSSGASSMR